MPLEIWDMWIIYRLEWSERLKSMVLKWCSPYTTSGWCVLEASSLRLDLMVASLGKYLTIFIHSIYSLFIWLWWGMFRTRGPQMRHTMHESISRWAYRWRFKENRRGILDRMGARQDEDCKRGVWPSRHFHSPIWTSAEAVCWGVSSACGESQVMHVLGWGSGAVDQNIINCILT